MNITTRIRDSVTILDVEGKLTGGGELQQAVQSLLGKGVTHILLNLDGVDWMDSSGLGELTAVKQAAGSQGAALKLLHAGGNVRQVLDTARLLGSFELYDQEVQAVSSFRP
jgi:anti-sigma B factor antagonist